MGRAKYNKRMRLHVGNETTQRHLPVYQHHKDQTAKARSRGIKCVSLLDIKFDGVSSAKLYQQRISRLRGTITSRSLIDVLLTNRPELFKQSGNYYPALR